MAFASPCSALSLSAFSPTATCALARRVPAAPSTARRAAAVRMAGESGSPSFSGGVDASKLRIGVVSTRWNLEYVSPMVTSVTETLGSLGVSTENVVSMQVPGAFEVPIAARLMCASQKVDAVICLGVLIKGATDHYEYIASAVSNGLMDLQLSTLIPVVFGVLTCETQAQAAERSTGAKAEAPTWARTAVEMAALRASQVGGVSTGKKSVGFF